MTSSSVPGERETHARLLWPDVVRVLATAAIFIYHFSSDYVAEAGVAHSSAERFIHGHFASWGIAAFVVLSGFSLTLSRLRVRRPYGEYVWLRILRLFAPYWTVALPFMLVGFVIGEAPVTDLWKVPVWLLGLAPVSPPTHLPMSEVWWYVSLALQISLLLPLLVYLYRRIGPVLAILAGMAVNLATVVLIGMAGYQWEYLAQEFVFARLAEVLAGLLAAAILVKRRIGAPVHVELLATAILVALLPFVYRIGTFTAWTTVAALAIVFLACSLWASDSHHRAAWVAVLAAYTYTFYLSHAAVAKYAMKGLFTIGIEQFLLVLPIVLAAACVVAWTASMVSARVTDPAMKGAARRLARLSHARRRHG